VIYLDVGHEVEHDMELWAVDQDQVVNAGVGRGYQAHETGSSGVVDVAVEVALALKGAGAGVGEELEVHGYTLGVSGSLGVAPP